MVRLVPIIKTVYTLITYAIKYTCFCSTFKQRILIQNNQLLILLPYNMFIYWSANFLISISSFYWQVFFKQVKESNETTNPEGVSFIIIINKLGHFYIHVVFYVGKYFLFMKHFIEMQIFLKFQPFL